MSHEFVTSGGEDFSPGLSMRLDYLEFLCNKIVLKCKRDTE